MIEGVSIDDVLLIGAFLPASELENNDGSLPFIETAMKKYLEMAPGSKLPSPASFLNISSQKFSDINAKAELDDFVHSGRSNGRSMCYGSFRIGPNLTFPLHAHPNIECIYVVSGTIHERRLKGEPPLRGPFQSEYSLDLSDLNAENFVTRSFKQGEFLVNEIGSVHRSFTLEDGAELFCLWGGSHCDVPVRYTPEAEQTQEQKAKKDKSCSAWIANALAEAGVDVVYGGHGGALVPLVNAIDAHPKLKWVCTRNEANASLMAAAHVKLTGKLGCVIATSGPGATNLTTGLLEAKMDRLPVIALTGLKPREGLHYSEFQDVDQSRLFAGGGLEFSVDVASPESLVPLLRDAVATATTKNTCAHLAIPVDVQAARCPINVDKRFCAAHAADRVAPPNAVDMECINQIVQDISSNNKNVLIAIGLRGVAAGKDILKLAEVLRAPIVTRLDAKGAVDESHPLALGIVGVHGKPGLENSAALIETCDIVLAFGVDDMTLLLCNTAGLQIRPMIEFEPTALMVGTRFRAIHTCNGDLSKIARALVEQLSKKNGGIPTSHDTTMQRGLGVDVKQGRRSILAPALWEAVHSDALKLPSLGRKPHLAASLMRSFNSNDWDSKEEEKELEAPVVVSEFGHPADILREVSAVLKDDDVVCVDTGDVTLWAALCLKRRAGRTLTSERLGTMGYALCAGIASCFAQKTTPATSIVLAGDGGFQMTLNELATFQQHKKPGDRLIVIVFDNQLLGRVIFGFQGARGCHLAGPDFAALAAAYGGNGYRVTDAVEAGRRVRDAAEGLTILHVPIDPTLKADMAIFEDGAVKVMNSG
jgi:acetolactate synthase-1/2/3 large subunit